MPHYRRWIHCLLRCNLLDLMYFKQIEVSWLIIPPPPPPPPEILSVVLITVNLDLSKYSTTVLHWKSSLALPGQRAAWWYAQEGYQIWRNMTLRYKVWTIANHSGSLTFKFFFFFFVSCTVWHLLPFVGRTSVNLERFVSDWLLYY